MWNLTNLLNIGAPSIKNSSTSSGWQTRTRSNWTWWFESYKSSVGANMWNPERKLRPIIRCSNEGEDARRISISSLKMGKDALRWRESCHPLSLSMTLVGWEHWTNYICMTASDNWWPMRLTLFLAIYGVSAKLKHMTTLSVHHHPSQGFTLLRCILYRTSIIGTALLPLSLVASGSGIFLILSMMVTTWAVLLQQYPRA